MCVFAAPAAAAAAAGAGTAAATTALAFAPAAAATTAATSAGFLGLGSAVGSKFAMQLGISALTAGLHYVLGQQMLAYQHEAAYKAA